MWNSITRIETPEILEKAYSLVETRSKVLFSGGTYLVAEKDPAIHTLIDINHLLDRSLTIEPHVVRIGAGATLQQIIDELQYERIDSVRQSAKWCCVSKNIRNQRTIGGEVARGRVDSELIALLSALDAQLSVSTSSLTTVGIRDWDGDGIVTAIEIDCETITTTDIQRFALIPSAPAFVIVAGVRRGQQIDVAVGGRANQISLLTVSEDEFGDHRIQEFSASAIKSFESDQYGSPQYKKLLIQVGLRRVRNNL